MYVSHAPFERVDEAYLVTVLRSESIYFILTCLSNMSPST